MTRSTINNILNRNPMDFLSSGYIPYIYKFYDIKTIRDLLVFTREELLSIDKVGKKTVVQIEDFLENHNLHLGMSLDEIALYEEREYKRSLSKPINWEQRRYEIAKELFALCSLDRLKNCDLNRLENYARNSVIASDLLVKELKQNIDSE